MSLLVFCRFIVSQFSGFLAFHETFKYDDNDDDGGDDDDDDDDVRRTCLKAVDGFR